jgi:hypothetical protein
MGMHAGLQNLHKDSIRSDIAIHVSLRTCQSCGAIAVTSNRTHTAHTEKDPIYIRVIIGAIPRAGQLAMGEYNPVLRGQQAHANSMMPLATTCNNIVARNLVVPT